VAGDQHKIAFVYAKADLAEQVRAIGIAHADIVKNDHRILCWVINVSHQLKRQ